MKQIKSVLLIAFALTLGLAACNSKTKTSEKKETAVPTITNKNEIIVDVRTPEEWNNDGHADCSVNYPLNEIESKIEELKKYDRVVLVCRSGNRAGTAQGILQEAGLKNVENLGQWQNISCD